MIYDGQSKWYSSAINQKPSDQRFGNMDKMTQGIKDLTLDNGIPKLKPEDIIDPVEMKARLARYRKEKIERQKRLYELEFRKLIAAPHVDEEDRYPNVKVIYYDLFRPCN